MFLVIKDKKTGKHDVVARVVRERYLELCLLNHVIVASIVIRTFADVEEALWFMKSMNEADKLLKTVL